MTRKERRMKERQNFKNKAIAAVSAMLILGGGALMFYDFQQKRTAAQQVSPVVEYDFKGWGSLSGAEIETLEAPELASYPTDQLFYTQERLDYEDGQMILKVPKLELEVPVLGDTDEETLKKGVGLYPYAQPPSLMNANVSIAGHRDIYGKEFYYIDTVGEGDKIMLDFDGKEYVYEYVNTIIVESDDWSPIYCKDFSAVTLTSCDPIGTSLNRIIVTGRLVDVIDLP